MAFHHQCVRHHIRRASTSNWQRAFETPIGSIPNVTPSTNQISFAITHYSQLSSIALNNKLKLSNIPLRPALEKLKY